MTQLQQELPFESPNDPEVSVWRYMDFTKFVSMLETRSLWFSRVDYLGDPYEGSTPRGESAFWESLRTGQPDKRDVADHNERSFRSMAAYSRIRTFANCWHINEYESAAMWQLYSRENASIAVQTTYRCLRDALPSTVGIGIVKYIDYETEKIPHSNIINYCMHKRISFEHERELRALIWAMGLDNKSMAPIWPIGEDTTGISVKVDLGILVSAIVLAPNSPVWFERLVASMVSRYDMKFEVIRSAMEKEPLV